MTQELHTAINANRDELRRWLAGEEELTEAEKASTTADCGAVGDFVILLTADDLPREPFTLAPGRVITDRGRFISAIHADIQHGGNGPRYCSGALQSDLKLIRDFLMREQIPF
jgi:hypothetical protein